MNETFLPCFKIWGAFCYRVLFWTSTLRHITVFGAVSFLLLMLRSKQSNEHKQTQVLQVPSVNEWIIVNVKKWLCMFVLYSSCVYIKSSSRWYGCFFERLYLEKMVSLYFWLNMPILSKTSLNLTIYMFIDFLRPLTSMAWPWWRGSANVGVCAFQSAFSSCAAVQPHLLAITLSCSKAFGWAVHPINISPQYCINLIFLALKYFEIFLF